MRRHPKPLCPEDLDCAARALACLPDTGNGALAALAWASVNLWRAASADRDDPFALSLTIQWALEIWCAETRPRERARIKDLWRALAAIAAALAAGEGDGDDDPSRGAIQFHHGKAAPDWALTKEASLWIGSWAFYGTVPEALKLEARGVSSAGFPP
jgi:hypothetical protein